VDELSAVAATDPTLLELALVVDELGPDERRVLVEVPTAQLRSRHTYEVPTTDYVRKMMVVLATGGQLPPLPMDAIGPHEFVTDGNHRLAAHQLLGIPTIRVWVRRPRAPSGTDPSIDAPTGAADVARATALRKALRAALHSPGANVRRVAEVAAMARATRVGAK
jgi:hypothetical protein